MQRMRTDLMGLRRDRLAFRQGWTDFLHIIYETKIRIGSVLSLARGIQTVVTTSRSEERRSRDTIQDTGPRSQEHNKAKRQAPLQPYKAYAPSASGSRDDESQRGEEKQGHDSGHRPQEQNKAKRQAPLYPYKAYAPSASGSRDDESQRGEEKQRHDSGHRTQTAGTK
jgi:hypothetical protein